jgi:hypothetical protein
MHPFQVGAISERGIPSWEPLDQDKKYTVTMPSYLAEGGDGFWFLKDVAWKVVNVALL